MPSSTALSAEPSCPDSHAPHAPEDPHILLRTLKSLTHLAARRTQWLAHTPRLAVATQVYDVWRLPSLDCSHIESLRPEAGKAVIISGIVAETTKRPPPPAPPKLANLYGNIYGGSTYGARPSLVGRARQLFQRSLDGDAGEAFKPDDAGANVLRDGFRAVLFSSCVLVFISLLGIALYCRPTRLLHKPPSAPAACRIFVLLAPRRLETLLRR